MNEGCAPCAIRPRPVAEAPTVAPEPRSCPGPLPAGGGGTGRRRHGPRRARRTRHLARADDATAGPDRRRRVGAHRRTMPGSHHRSGSDQRHGRRPRAQGGGRRPEGVLRRGGHRKTGRERLWLDCRLRHRPDFMGVPRGWACVARVAGAGRRGRRWAPGRSEPESPWICESGEGSERRAAHRARTPCRKRSVGGTGPLPAPCNERFRPRAANLAGVRCVGREARMAASSGEEAQWSMTTFSANSTWPSCAVATRKRTGTREKPRLSERGFDLKP